MPPAKKTATKRAPRKPQDRKPKADPDGGYTFTHDGKAYTLPSGADAAENITGRDIRDAYLDGEEGQMRLGLRMLEQVAPQDVLDAMYAMPATEMLDHLANWMSTSRVGEPSLGESLR